MITMPESSEPLILIIPIHVDDGPAICNSPSLDMWFVQEISKKVDFVCLGPIVEFIMSYGHLSFSLLLILLYSHLHIIDY